MDESQEHYALWRKLDTKIYIIYNSINSAFPEKKGYRDRNMRWEETDTKGHKEILGGNENFLFVNCIDSSMTVFAKTHWTLHQKGEFHYMHIEPQWN